MSTLTQETRAQVKEARDQAMRERLPRTPYSRDLAGRCYSLAGGDGHLALLLAINHVRHTQKP